MTKKRIEFICGSIESFLKDPSQIREGKLNPNFEWMRRVTPQEAQACLERMQIWIKKDNSSTSGVKLGEWLFNPLPSKPFLNLTMKKPDLVMSKTPGAAQRKWCTPTEFPCCPQKSEEAPIAAYNANLSVGAIFCRNNFSTSKVLEAAIANDGHSIFVMCEQVGMKPMSLAKITFEDGLYVHASLGTFFTKDGAEKQFCLARGLEWDGGDTFDDYC